MKQNDTIDVAELRGLSDRLFARLEENGVRAIRIDSQYYWMIFPVNAFDMQKKPELIAGNVLDDLQDLQNDADADEDEFISVWHGFHHLAGLLQFIASADLKGHLITAPAKKDRE
jgi:hypothetical protein